MTHIQLVSRLLFCVFAVASLAQCGGGKNKAQNAMVEITPDIPIVITADIKVGAKEYKSPWFAFRVEIDNQTEQAFEIVALQAEITGTDSSGLPITKSVTWVPSDLNYTLDTLQCTYNTFGIWGKNIKRSLQITGTGGCNSGLVDFIADDNPSGPNKKSFRNRVKLKPLGWFIDDEGNPDDRFEKIKTFFTK